jgi:hypothetical protein
MLEIWCEEFAPDTFFEQSAQTFGASLRGRVERHRRDAERDLALAYHTGAFSRASKPKPLRHYLAQLRSSQDPGAGLLGGFRALKARGLPVSIKRVN